MEFNVKIKEIEKWFRESTKDWCIRVIIQTDNTSVAITYCGNTPKRAQENMLKFLPEDMLRDELDFRKTELLNSITEE